MQEQAAQTLESPKIRVRMAGGEEEWIVRGGSLSGANLTKAVQGWFLQLQSGQQIWTPAILQNSTVFFACTPNPTYTAHILLAKTQKFQIGEA